MYKIDWVVKFLLFGVCIILIFSILAGVSTAMAVLNPGFSEIYLISSISAVLFILVALMLAICL